MVLKAASGRGYDDADDAFDNPLPSRMPPGGWEADDRRLALQRDLARANASSWRWRVLGALTLTLIWAWAFRWQVAAVENHGTAHSAVLMVNRWTGEMRFVQNASSFSVEEISR